MELLTKVSKKRNHRHYPGVFGRRPDLRKFRQDEAKERQEAWDKLSPKEKLEALDRRLGKGAGAKRQRACLSAAKKSK